MGMVSIQTRGKYLLRIRIPRIHQSSRTPSYPNTAKLTGTVPVCFSQLYIYQNVRAVVKYYDF